MKRNLMLLGILMLGLIVVPSQGVFVQCPVAGGTCDGDEGATDDADVINGSAFDDEIRGLGGDDFIIGGDGGDEIFGEDDSGGLVGNDIIFGGPGADIINGNDGTDVLFPGPDDGVFSQLANGQGEGGGADSNDIINVFAGEITTCLTIDGGGGSRDIVNLIGFGPYSLELPFGLIDMDQEGVIHVVDPIGGGDIFIEIDLDGEGDTEVINGLPSPNVVFLDDDNPISQACPLLVDGNLVYDD
jgi:Ca2+-binding RTX toxin-like protein